MRKYEYKVVPVPAKCVSMKGTERGTDPAAHTIETVLNDLGVEGWEFVRADRVTLRKGGLLGRGELTREMLVFRRHPVTLTERPKVEGLLEAPGVSAVRARRVTRPELLEGAKSGRRKLTPRPDLADENAIAAE